MHPYNINTPSGIIYYMSNRKKDKITLLLIHGAGGHSKLFLRQMQYFKNKFNIIALDLPGHGRSKWQNVPSVKDFTGSVISVLEHENISSFIATGHSMGGGVALELFKRIPEMFSGIVLISTGAVLPVSEMIFNLMENDFDSFCSFLLECSYSKKVPEIMKEFSLRELQLQGSSVVKNDFKICSCFDYRDVLSSISMPALIIANNEDKMVPVNISRELSDSIKGSRFISYSAGGHMPHLEEHERLNEDIFNFISNSAVF